MSQESATPDPVELARLGFDALNRGDVDGFLSTWAPGAVWDLNAWGIGSFEGMAAIRGFVEDWLGNYEDYLAEAEEIVDLGDGVVFVAYREVARPLRSEGNLERRRAQVSLFVEGRVERFTTYTDIAEARAAAERLAESRG
jgi:ketosteroid isomerase-like protein